MSVVIGQMRPLVAPPMHGQKDTSQLALEEVCALLEDGLGKIGTAQESQTLSHDANMILGAF